MQKLAVFLSPLKTLLVTNLWKKSKIHLKVGSSTVKNGHVLSGHFHSLLGTDVFQLEHLLFSSLNPASCFSCPMAVWKTKASSQRLIVNCILLWNKVEKKGISKCNPPFPGVFVLFSTKLKFWNNVPIRGSMLRVQASWSKGLLWW